MKHSDIYKRIYSKTSSSSSKESNLRQKADTLKSKLGKYAAVSTALVAVGSPNLDATIQHTPVSVTLTKPSPTPTNPQDAGDGYAVDFNGDNIDDASVIQVYSASYPSLAAPLILPFNARVLQTTAAFSTLAYKVNSGQTINSLLGSFATVSTKRNLAYISTPNYTTYHFAGDGVKYIAVAFPINNQTHYGWIEVEVSANGEMTDITGFAYEDCPCQGIVAGATTGGPGATCPPADCPFEPTVPTLSEWGLITLAIFLLSFGTLYIGRREEVLAAQSSSGEQFKIGHFWQKPPFEWAVFWKTLLATAGLAAVAGGLSLFAYGTIAAADLIGTAIAGPLFAYLMHLLWIFEREDKK